MASYSTLRVLCHSLAGNAVYVVTVTSRGSAVEDRRKRAVVVTARVHPGETGASWMMEGFLDFLLGDSDDARLLRDAFVFKVRKVLREKSRRLMRRRIPVGVYFCVIALLEVVPMLNPDGVIVGNYRCSLAGRDLNRNYQSGLRDSFPSVWHTRRMVERYKPAFILKSADRFPSDFDFSDALIFQAAG